MNAIALVFVSDITMPPAAKVLAIAAAVYPILQLLKKVPAFTPYLTGWVAIGLNVLLTLAGDLILVPPDQLYTLNTAVAILTGVLTAAGFHGTVSAMSPPQVLATIPPSTQIKEVPATLQPVNPAAVPVEPPKA